MLRGCGRHRYGKGRYFRVSPCLPPVWLCLGVWRHPSNQGSHISTENIFSKTKKQIKNQKNRQKYVEIHYYQYYNRINQHILEVIMKKSVLKITAITLCLIMLAFVTGCNGKEIEIDMSSAASIAPVSSEPKSQFIINPLTGKVKTSVVFNACFFPFLRSLRHVPHLFAYYIIFSLQKQAKSLR